jgi:hypothetical protein
VAEAVEMALAGLGWLAGAGPAGADVAGMPGEVQAECLRGLERVRSVWTAAHARVLGGFDAGLGYEADGQGSARTWLRWQARVTPGAAAGSIGWMRRLRGHPEIADALRRGAISASWAREICALTGKLPDHARAQADRILLSAAAGGAELADLLALAEEIRRQLADPDADDGDDGFEDRRLRLKTTLDGAGRLDADLTGDCATALQAVLDSLGKKAGPQDTRTQPQRHHDALEEACRLLIAARCLPDRAGQPVQLQLHISLDELTRRMEGDIESGAPAGPSDPAAGPAAASAPGLPGPAPAPGQECDAAIAPIVTGRLDPDLLGQLTARLAGASPGRAAISDLITANAVALLSGPGRLASLLRTGALPGPAASISLPLDTGTSTETIPAHLRRAVITRDQHCAAPGCDVPPARCHVHHIRPRSKGGHTRLPNLLLLCAFHHLIMVHRWGWTITLNADGTTTARSPDGREYHSHSPPNAA